VVGTVVARDQERSLGQVVLGGHCLHRGRVEETLQQHHRGRVPGEASAAESVDLPNREPHERMLVPADDARSARGCGLIRRVGGRVLRRLWPRPKGCSVTGSGSGECDCETRRSQSGEAGAVRPPHSSRTTTASSTAQKAMAWPSSSLIPPRAGHRWPRDIRGPPRARCQGRGSPLVRGWNR
jgi:hypothetical protein